MNSEFFEKLRNFLNERFNDEMKHKQFKIETYPMKRKWEIYRQELISCRYMCEYKDRRVQIGSLCFDAPARVNHSHYVLKTLTRLPP
ncbi:MAG: hypothetical protein FGF53_07390 [Candidatus Brockarchaeota archaeon]|nr:hypothetical protein [Candidatus Brockarchaeota archaeon]MBO3809576.1 hypothetical protein [Candidatus Brockarchaeota archaeon]